MSLSQNGAVETGPPERRRTLGQRLFARFGSTAILIAVLLVVVGWIGVLCGTLLWLLRLIHS